MRKPLSLILAIFLFFLLFNGSAFCQINIVKDLNDGSLVPNSGAYPYNLTVVGNNVFFTAKTPLNGIELWKTDGTSAGTMLVKDINPGFASSEPKNLINANGKLFFTANNGSNGRGLWISDGTEAGTHLIVDLMGNRDLPFFHATTIGEKLFFALGDDLWKSDGTETGTGILRSGVGNPQKFTSVGNLFFFQAKNSDQTGNALWKSDGTEEGTVIVKESDLEYINQPTNINGTLYFAAYDSIAGEELWKSDGTEEGTVMIKDINVNGSSRSSSFTAFHDSVYFLANDGVHGYEIWKTNGTEAGTVIHKDMNPGSYDFYCKDFTVLNDILYFSGGMERLYRTDGTSNGTYLVSDENNQVKLFQSVNNHLFFEAFSDDIGFSLWKSDGTSLGTIQLKDINPHSNDNYWTTINQTVKLGDKFIFSGFNSDHGWEIYISDGTSEGTNIIKEINTQGNSGVGYIKAAGERVFFNARDGLHGYEVWSSDGTEAGTLMTKDINPDMGFSNPATMFFAFNNEMFFLANDGIHGYELWKSDGTPAGTSLVKDIIPGQTGIDILNYNEINDQLYFFIKNPQDSISIWKTDGTDQGTVEVVVLPGISNIYESIEIENIVFFGASHNESGWELWKTDGTQEGTILVRDINPGLLGSQPSAFYNLKGTLLFNANDGTHGVELWKSDGSLSGTVLLKDIFPSGSSGGIVSAFVKDSILIFTADDGSTGNELWKSDGTTNGTIQIMDIFDGSRDSNPSKFTAVGEHVYFIVYGSKGHQLWRTNGNARETYAIKDDFVVSGFTSDHTIHLISINTQLYAINTDDYFMKTEVWKINNMLACLMATQTDLDVEAITQNGDKLFINGYSQQYGGSELFVYNASGDAPCKKDQQIIFHPLPLNNYVGNLPFSLNAYSSSGLPVSFKSSNPAVASVSENQLTIHTTGETTIIASQAGDQIWNAAPDVTQTLEVGMMVSAEEDILNNISVYPNPFANTISINCKNSLNSPYSLSVFDLTGNLVQNINILPSQHIGQQWPAGVYLLKFKSGEKIKVMKVVKTSK